MGWSGAFSSPPWTSSGSCRACGLRGATMRTRCEAKAAACSCTPSSALIGWCGLQVAAFWRDRKACCVLFADWTLNKCCCAIEDVEALSRAVGPALRVVVARCGRAAAPRVLASCSAAPQLGVPRIWHDGENARGGLGLGRRRVRRRGASAPEGGSHRAAAAAHARLRRRVREARWEWVTSLAGVLSLTRRCGRQGPPDRGGRARRTPWRPSGRSALPRLAHGRIQRQWRAC